MSITPTLCAVRLIYCLFYSPTSVHPRAYLAQWPEEMITRPRFREFDPCNMSRLKQIVTLSHHVGHRVTSRHHVVRTHGAKFLDMAGSVVRQFPPNVTWRCVHILFPFQHWQIAESLKQLSLRNTLIASIMLPTTSHSRHSVGYPQVVGRKERSKGLAFRECFFVITPRASRSGRSIPLHSPRQVPVP